MALVGSRDLIDLTLENMVINRAGRFKVFHEIDPALQWLGVVEEDYRASDISNCQYLFRYNPF